MSAYDVGAVEVSLAEFLADGGKWDGDRTDDTTNGELANTGLNLPLLIAAGVGLVGASLLTSRFIRRSL